jgi:ArsR family transcriptional regulator, arsenate/arsenite/antimonite-responsive transcriptional repressor
VRVKAIAALTAECPPLLAGPLDQDEADRLAAALKAVADSARLRLLSLIQAQPTGEACVCHLTGPLGLTQPTVSHHLKILLDAGLVEREQRGSWAYYRLLPDRLRTLRDLLG